MKPNGNRYLIILYILIETVILLAIKAAEHFSSPLLRYVQFLAIIVNTGVMLYFRFSTEKDSRENLLALALFMTLFGDLFLTFLGFTLTGIICFCVIQIVYAFYLCSPRTSWILRSVVFVLLIAVAYIIGQLNAITAAGLLNISILAVNAGESVLSKNERISILYKTGMILFFMCDF